MSKKSDGAVVASWSGPLQVVSEKPLLIRHFNVFSVRIIGEDIARVQGAFPGALGMLNGAVSS